MGAQRTTTRDIARAAVRAQLAQVAFDLFVRDGFENVTVNDIAAAAGVSRSTFLRYFAGKEEAVLGAFDSQGEQFADALRARPAGEDDWAALRHALGLLVDYYRRDPRGALAMSRLIRDTPALCARQSEKQDGWRPLLAAALADRDHSGRRSPIRHAVLAAAALDCLDIAVEEWTASDGRQDLEALLDEAFDVIKPRRGVSAGRASSS